MPYLPPLNLIRKKMNSWHLTSRLTARSFSESTASRVRSGRCPRQCATLLHGQMYLQEKRLFCNLATRWNKIFQFVPSFPIYGWLTWWCDFFPVGPAFEDHPQEFGQKKVQPLGFYFWYIFSSGLTFRYVLVNSHLVHPPSNSWLLALGILQTYPLSESFMIDFLMPYIHRLIDQPPLNHDRQKLISCHCTSGSFQEKDSGPFLVWYFIPGPISCPGTLTHCLLDFWKIVFFKKRTEPPGKKTGSTEGGNSRCLMMFIFICIYIYMFIFICLWRMIKFIKNYHMIWWFFWRKVRSEHPTRQIHEHFAREMCIHLTKISKKSARFPINTRPTTNRTTNAVT